MSDSGGILMGVGVLSQGISLLLVQSVIIIALTRALSLFNSYTKQPRVVMEIIGGILLGPSALGRDQSYMNKIFPTSSLSSLNLVANFGLVLYLFLVGLELDPKLVLRNRNTTALVALIGTIVPFALGVSVSPTLFDYFLRNDPLFKDVKYTSFMVFIGVAMSITAFPVLARVLTETKLLASPAGALTMGAAAMGDVVAWCLLTLAISIASSGSMQTAAYIFLCVCAFTLGLFVFIRPVFHFLVAKVEEANSNSMRSNLFALTIICVYLCAWTTELLGVHPIFGAFIFGLMAPRHGRFVIELTEKIETFVQTLLLPLYFAASGLKTNISSIKTAEAGGLMILVITLACLGKVIGCGSVAKLSGMSWRESGAVGFLMSTRGLVELIVLNVGLQKGILNEEVFTVMVMMALVTTLITVPVVELIYPPKKRKLLKSGSLEEVSESAKKDRVNETHISLVVDKIEDVPTSMGFLYMFAPVYLTKKLNVTAMHFHETSRTLSEVFAATDNVVAAAVDPALQSLSMFCSVVGAEIDTYSIVGNPFGFSDELCRLASSHNSNLVVLPWRKSVNYVGDYFDQFLWKTLKNSPTTVALVASHPPTDHAEDLKPITTHVIRKVVVIMTGHAMDLRLLDIITRYQNHAHISTTVICALSVSAEIHSQLAALKKFNVVVIKAPVTTVSGIVKVVTEETYDLVLCSFLLSANDDLVSESEESKDPLSPRSKARAVWGSSMGPFSTTIRHPEFGSIGMQIYDNCPHSLLIVVHTRSEGSGIADENEVTIMVKKRNKNPSMNISTFDNPVEEGNEAEGKGEETKDVELGA